MGITTRNYAGGENGSILRNLRVKKNILSCGASRRLTEPGHIGCLQADMEDCQKAEEYD